MDLLEKAADAGQKTGMWISVESRRSFMHRHFKHFLHRHEPKGHWQGHLKSGVGAITGMTAVGALAIATGIPLLIAPFGATAVLIFGQPKSPLAQPANVLGGYLLAAIVGSLAMALLPGLWWAAAIAVGLAIAAMLILRVTHPPAGAVPLVAFGSHLSAWTLFTVVGLGGLLLIVIAVLHHLIPPRQQYPLRAD
ncbi:HPP family protein [Rhizobium lusitanum]|jgi:CBS-domain-containing membrane protein|uniref:HPP family protein n=2 Tax=Rhizobium/Agrobacterium group TaxID=227290 RepID=A0A1C3W5E5_9HYPH|nr:HPP family protein [Rhizobium lusitanum]